MQGQIKSMLKGLVNLKSTKIKDIHWTFQDQSTFSWHNYHIQLPIPGRCVTYMTNNKYYWYINIYLDVVKVVTD